MRTRRPTCIILTVYDVLRLIAILGSAYILRDAMLERETLATATALLAFSASQALFPLMALFLVVDFNRFSAFSTLYVAGKLISATAFGAFMLSSSGDLLKSGGFYVYNQALLMTVTLGCALLDLISAFIAARVSREAPGPVSPEGAD